MLSLDSRIQLSYQTLSYIEDKCKILFKKVNSTNNKSKLQKLLDESRVWGAKCDREKQIIQKLINESGADISDFS